MKRRDFILNSTLSLAAISLVNEDIISRDSDGKKVVVGAHVWVYAASQPGYDVSPILGQIFSDVAYAGFDGVETMEHPLRSSVYTRQIRESLKMSRDHVRKTMKL